MVLARFAHHVTVPALEDLDRRPHVIQTNRTLKVLIKNAEIWKRKLMVTSDVNFATWKVSIATSEVIIVTSEVSITTSEVSITTSEISIATSEVSIATLEISIATLEVSIATSEVRFATSVHCKMLLCFFWSTFLNN